MDQQIAVTIEELLDMCTLKIHKTNDKRAPNNIAYLVEARDLDTGDVVTRTYSFTVIDAIVDAHNSALDFYNRRAQEAIWEDEWRAYLEDSDGDWNGLVSQP